MNGRKEEKYVKELEKLRKLEVKEEERAPVH